MPGSCLCEVFCDVVTGCSELPYHWIPLAVAGCRDGGRGGGEGGETGRNYSGVWEDDHIDQDNSNALLVCFLEVMESLHWIERERRAKFENCVAVLYACCTV